MCEVIVFLKQSFNFFMAKAYWNIKSFFDWCTNCYIEFGVKL